MSERAEALVDAMLEAADEVSHDFGPLLEGHARTIARTICEHLQITLWPVECILDAVGFIDSEHDEARKDQYEAAMRFATLLEAAGIERGS